MIPVWKIKRELGRLRDQVIGLPAYLAALPMRLSEPRRRAAYDRDFDRNTRLTEGDIPRAGRVAIFLIYQPNGISPSTLATCRWLSAAGYAPFLVANSQVNDTDRAKLSAECWRLLERPNFGYDFGGYRDAILLLSRWGIASEQLIVMNDSVWMPMVPDLLARVEAVANDADVVGLLQDEKVRHDTKGGQAIDRRRHLESYFYLFSKAAQAHPAFLAFWQDYRMTDYKPHTIKHGELGFSWRMAEAGLTLEALTKRSVFLERLAEKDDAFLRRTLQYAAYEDRESIRSAKALALLDPSQPGWRGAALEHIRRAVNRRRFNACFPYAQDRIFGTLYLKKSSETIFAAMRSSYLAALADGQVAMPPAEILAEIQASVGKYAPALGDAAIRPALIARARNPGSEIQPANLKAHRAGVGGRGKPGPLSPLAANVAERSAQHLPRDQGGA